MLFRSPYRGVRIGEYLGQPRMGMLHCDSEFFVEFTRKRRDHRLAGLDLAAGKFPVPFVDLSRRASPKQETAIGSKYDRNRDIDGA